jgi:parafibromin
MHAKKHRAMHPIIIISSSPTSLITMHNVKNFLQDASFEPSADARTRAAAEGNARPEDMIPVYRTRTTIDSAGREVHAQTRYVVVDSVEALNKFGADAWDRVVCVLTTGQAWQFRPYKWPEPRSLFHHGASSHSGTRTVVCSRSAVKGMYVSWSNDPPNPKIKDWNVTELKVPPVTSLLCQTHSPLRRSIRIVDMSTSRPSHTFGRRLTTGRWSTSRRSCRD